MVPPELHRRLGDLALGEKRAQTLFVLIVQRLFESGKVADEICQFGVKRFGVKHEKLRPQVYVEFAHPCHVGETAGAKPLFFFYRAAFAVTVRHDMRQLRSIRDNPVVMYGVRHLDAAETDFLRQRAHFFHGADVGAVRRDDETRPVKQIFQRIIEAGKLPARHGVRPHKTQAALFRLGRKRPDDFFFNAACVKHDGAFFYVTRVLGEKLNFGSRRQREYNHVGGAHVLRRDGLFYCAAFFRLGERFFVGIENHVGAVWQNCGVAVKTV